MVSRPAARGHIVLGMRRGMGHFGVQLVLDRLQKNVLVARDGQLGSGYDQSMPLMCAREG